MRTFALSTVTCPILW